MIDDVRIYLRERYNGWYGAGAFVVSNTLTSLPFLYLIASELSTFAAVTSFS